MSPLSTPLLVATSQLPKAPPFDLKAPLMVGSKAPSQALHPFLLVKFYISSQNSHFEGWKVHIVLVGSFCVTQKHPQFFGQLKLLP